MKKPPILEILGFTPSPFFESLAFTVSRKTLKQRFYSSFQFIPIDNEEKVCLLRFISDRIRVKVSLFSKVTCDCLDFPHLPLFPFDPPVKLAVTS